MAWSTTIVAPPDGSMSAYMASLKKLLDRADDIYWPGHGGPVRNTRTFRQRSMIVHRQWREAAILRRLAAGDTTIAAVVSSLYRDLAPSLRGAAGLSVLAHLIDLVERRQAQVDGSISLSAHFHAA